MNTILIVAICVNIIGLVVANISLFAPKKSDKQLILPPNVME